MAPRTVSLVSTLGLLSCLLSPVVAQTFSYCNPLKQDDCPAAPALGQNFTTNFTNQLSEKVWNTTNGIVDITEHGANFTINQRLDSPTLQSYFYIFFGTVEVHMKAATGRGVVSSIVIQSEVLDEIDWEWVGSDTNKVQTNYFGKGNTTSYDRGKTFDVPGAMDAFHNYTVNWTPEKIEWYIDTKLVRTLMYEEALGGKNFPQTPSTVRLGIWPGGDPLNKPGVIEWAGGEIDYSHSPYTMSVQQLKVVDAHSGKEYQYSDKSGDWQSIKVVGGVSDIANEINKPPAKSLAQRWRELPSAAKIAIFASIGGAVLLGMGVIAFCCVKQRRVGRREFSMENSKFVEDQNNVMAMRTQWSHKYKPVGA
ncbi:extracellular cell wall glucanase Crf1/allergen Asp F9 [Arthroderma uncinatum]|uniref:extracellular cell wall glucanase Crf1/allergen Asp F9 n=1 Tax=Arthroderma uncinatum TaxID=74035 RepID=UPI00144AD61C|nr:extracellular cell wall glucanase Crf1/allergen Asp F9 [Arthroderma uncinatum]KAF3483424.1 extracellular cell wall glucanase Crf1/allergen Asp F9 [Arthroderma uncinatum]